jgi:ABC-type antimicrobial peptide transport system permease subunit
VESAEYALERTGAGISVGFGIFGTLLAALGIFGAFLQAAIQSRRESAVRKALGATQLRLLTSQLGAAALNVAIGCALGILGGQALNALLRGLLSGVATIDLPTYLGAAALMLAVGLAASVSPAIRVARTNAMQVLREG